METAFLIPQEITASLGIPQIIDIRDQLPVNPRYGWGELERVRSLDDITTPVMHHDALSKASTARYSDVELARRIAQSHINSTGNVPGGDAGFPYDIWIRNGRAYRCNDLLPLKYGVKSNNTYTLHICVSGDYATFDTLTDPDRKALVGVLLALKRFLPAFQGFKSHKEIMPTLCPGYDANKIKADVAALELDLSLKNTQDMQIAKIVAARARHAGLYDTYVTAKDPALKAEAYRKLSKIASDMEAAKILIMN